MTSEYTRSPNPNRLNRDRDNGMVAGVCAGLAEHFKVEVTWVRIAALVSLLFMAPFTLMGYLIAAVVIPARDTLAPPVSREEERFWRGVSREPAQTMSGLKYRFQDLDQRLQNMERVVTSNEWRLRRQFREIE